jgi:pentapeptide repeat protein
VTTLAIIAVLCALFVVGLAIWLIPRRQVEHWRRAGISNEEKLAELGVQARSSITQALGGLALIVTIAISAYQVNEARKGADKTLKQTRESGDNAQRSAAKNLGVALDNLDLTRQGQVSERFSRAVDQLGTTNEGGSPAIDVRAGALFSLMRIGIDAPDHRQPALLVAMTYVTNNYVPPTSRPPHGCQATFDRKRPDIGIALGVLPRIAAKLKEGELRGLRGANLNGLALDDLILNRFDLRNIKFRDASLARAHFHRAKLQYADLRRACLKEADFSEASLQNADFRGASLQGANFKDARLKGAKFSTPEERNRAPLSAEQKREATVVSR